MFLLVNRLRSTLSCLGVRTIALHLALIIGVALYTICGALIMSNLESYRIETSSIVNESQLQQQQRSNEEDTETKNMSIVNYLEIDQSIHPCVVDALATMFNKTNCVETDVNRFIIADIDKCYQSVNLDILLLKEVTEMDDSEESNNTKDEEEEDDDENSNGNNDWSFTNSLIFTYTIITTIGYGNVAPVTFEGRLFLIIYGLIGVPLTLITIADLGMFFSKMMKSVTAILMVYFIKAKTLLTLQFQSRKFTTDKTTANKNDEIVVTVNGKSDKNNNNDNVLTSQSSAYDELLDRETCESLALLVTFFGYLLSGSYIVSLYEPELDFFKAFYFNFVTLTTVGLGDFVPKRETYLIVTMLYITFGLALTTLAIEIAGDYLRRLHYFGRKIEHVASTEIWFGGKKMKVKNLITYLGDHFNIPADQLKQLNLDEFIDSAIKVENGELETLRKAEVKVELRVKPCRNAIMYKDLRKSGESDTLKFVDDWTSTATSGSEMPLVEETPRTISSMIPKANQRPSGLENVFVSN